MRRSLVKQYSYRERDYAFGQLMLTLRITIGLTQAGLAERLGVSRRAVLEWEGGLSYPKAERLTQLIELAVRVSAFPAGREEEQIRALWKAAHQKVLLNEAWLADLLSPAAGVPLAPPPGTPAATAVAEPAAFRRVDWVEALNTSHFTGREVEVAELTQWILEEHCRLVSVLGMGGIGKSMLASYLGQHLAPQFEAVLWRSVRDAPECSELVADCLTFFSQTPPAEFPSSLEQRINQLVARLQASRCLLVLDNLETLLASGDPEGNYLPGYEGYRRLIERLAEAAHQSCVLLTSRERPREIEALEGVRSPVRSLRLVGLDEQAARVLLFDKGLSGTPAAWGQLVATYTGNPLALKIVAQAISDLFGGDLDRFLRDGELIFNGIRPVLRQQVGRLTPLEHLLLTWLAVLREWTKLDTLSQVLHPRVRRAQLLEALEALGRRSLVERGRQASFSLQSVVMEYLTDVLVEHLSEEVVLGNPQQLRLYALEQSQAKDYVREIQVRLLVHPLLERLRAELGTDSLVEAHLLGLLAQFRSEDATTQGYGPANVMSLLTELRGHLRGLDLSRLAIRGAYLQGVELQDASLARATLHEVVFTEAFDTIRAVAMSPDGHYIAAGSNNGQVRVWREEGRVAHLTIRGHTDRVGAIAFSPDGQALATASWDGTVRLWDVASGAAIWTGQDQHAPVTSLAFGPNGQLISGSYDGALHVWDLRTGTPLKSLPTQGGPIFTVACSPDGRLLASGGMDAGIRLWDAAGGTLLKALPGHREPVSTLAFARETGLFASGSLDQVIKLWEVETGTCLRTLEGHTGLVIGLAWSPDDRTLASASYDTTIRLWDSRSWQCHHILQGHRDGVTSLAFLPGGDRLLSGSLDHTLRTWDVQSGQNVRTMTGYGLALLALSWSPDGRFVVSGSSEATLTLWEVTTRTPVRVLRGHQQRVDAVAWSRATNRIASGSTDHTVRLWDARTGVCTHLLRGHTAQVLSVNWSPDGSRLASGSNDGSVRIWDVQAGTSQVGLEQGGLISTVVWSPDGTLLASASEDGLVHISRAADGSLVRRFERAGVVEALCWSPDGEQLVSGTADGAKGVVFLWDVRQGTLVRRLEGHRGPIMGVDWSREHNLLLSAGTDGTVRWWDPEQGVPLATVQAHDAWARAVRVSPDGQTVASCGEDGVIQLWDMQSHQHLATLRAERPYERLDISGTRGLTNAQQAALRALGAWSAELATPPVG
jgi:WD40 repeat protein/transcriptional regulator with XRE-family HTH domain